MLDFNLYSEYINIVKKTNSIFDAWFFIDDSSCKKLMSKKRYINQLSFSRQTEEIIDLLISAKAPEKMIKAFKLRKEIEFNNDVSKQELDSVLNYIESIEAEYKVSTLS